MAFEVNITPEDIDNLVKDGIMKAGIGKSIQDAISKTLNGYNSPIEAEVKKYIAEIVAELIREKYNVQIKEAIAKAVEEKVTPEIIDKTVDTAMERIVKSANDRY